MAEKNDAEAPEVEIDLDAQTFDLGAWVAGTHTYPSYKATVHLDKEAVARSNEALSEIKKIDKRLPELREAAEKAGGGDSLGETSGPRAAYNKAIADRRQFIKTYDSYRKKALASALTISFRSKGVGAQKRARAKLEELIPGIAQMSEKDIQDKLSSDEELASKQQTMLFMELVDTIVNSDGKHVNRDTLTEEGVTSLLKPLAQRDTMRVATAMNMAMLASELVEEEIDAGFLG